ncbi:MAG TPA: M1 family metallopeptidase [Thermoanaerobaculia bacterium]|nr:M1 family metallopeptidase [Thermoanaerobaculia bacterium]
MTRRLLPIVLFCAAAAAAQNPFVDVQHYRIEIDVPAAGNEIAAIAELTVKPLMSSTTLELDFGALEIDEVLVEGERAAFERTGERLRIETGVRAAPFKVRIRYHGKPADGLFLQANKYGDHGAFADNWPNRAHHWFPSVDHPSDKASVELLITAPAKYGVVANGTHTATTTLPDGRKRTHWSEPAPIPVHCMVFGATEFAVVRAGEAKGTPIEYYLYPLDRERGVREFGRTQQIVELYSTLFGPYPYGKLALVESSTRFGGMENASAIFLDEKRIDGHGTMERLVAHEIAHQWFGNSVTQREWADLWLSEGFATYFGDLFFERADGAEAFAQRMRESRDAYLKANANGSRPVYNRTTDLSSLLNRFTCEKGAWVLHMLRGIMGDAPFFAAVREYYTEFRDRNATTEELRAVMEKHAGQPLDWFFQQWIFERGHPVYSVTWNWNEGKTAITIEQTQGGTVFRMPMVVEVRSRTGSQRQTVLIDERREQIEIAIEQSPMIVVIDPEEWVLKEMAQ